MSIDLRIVKQGGHHLVVRQTAAGPEYLTSVFGGALAFVSDSGKALWFTGPASARSHIAAFREAERATEERAAFNAQAAAITAAGR
jgi:hypothetical protein